MMRRLFRVGIAVLSLSAPALVKSEPPPGFVETTFIDNDLIDQATGLAWAPDGSNRLFVIRKGGEVRVIENGVLRPEPFATLPQVFTNSECGLIGICFDPDFLTNRFVYLFVTLSDHQQSIVRYRDENGVGEDLTSLVPGLPTAGQNHDGGAVGIGPDGHLYWAIGDLGNGTGVNGNLTSLAAKVGRANRFTGAPVADNPFNDGAGPNNEYIWARGFRNPFTMTFHPITGDLWLNVVGTNYEQAFIVNRGDHGGYNAYENNQPPGFLQPKIVYRTNGTDTRNITAQGAVRAGNVATFATNQNHGFRTGGKVTIANVDDASFNGTFYVRERISPTSFSVSQTGPDASSGDGTATSAFVGGCMNGGTFYESTLFPAEYRGNFFFGDFNSGNLMRATIEENRSVTSVDTFATGASSYVDAATGPDGALYHTGFSGGIVKRIAPLSVPQGLIVYPTAIRVQEGSQSLFTVRLTQAPAGDVTVNIAKRAGGDLNLNTATALLTFTPDNWNVPQSILVTADSDQDRTIGKVEFDLSADGMETQTVSAFELDGISQSTFPKTLAFRTGDPVPNEAEGTIFKTFGIPSLNNDSLGFRTTIQTPTGKRSAIFFGERVLLRQDDPAPGTDARFSAFKDPVFNGAFVVIASIKGGVDTNARNDEGIWRYESEPQLIAREGDPAPGANGATFQRFVSLALPAPQGAVFVAQLRSGSGEGEQIVNSTNDLGLWREVNGVPVLLVREGDTLTLDSGSPRKVKGFQTLGFVPGSEDQRRSHSFTGSVLALVDFEDGTQGIIECPGDGGALIARVVTGDAIASPAGEIMDRLGIPAFANPMIAFTGTLKTSALVGADRDAAIFVGTEGGDFSALVREGDIAPSTGDALFTGFSPPALSSANSILTFHGSLKKGSGDPAVNQGSDTGLWTTSGGSLRLIAREGQLAVGTSGYFAKFLSFAVFPEATPTRAIAFTASLRLGKGRVAASNRLGLWAMDKDGNLELVQRTGDKVELPGDRTTRVLAQLALKAAPQSPGQGRAMDENGKFAYRATFKGGAQGIYVVQLP